jgi:cell division protein YceG involved in septum cleavage
VNDEYEDEEEYPRERRSLWSVLMNLGSVAITCVVAVLILAAGVIFETHRPGPTVDGGADTIIVIPKGQGVSGIAATLDENGVVRSALVFRVAAELFAHGQSL